MSSLALRLRSAAARLTPAACQAGAIYFCHRPVLPCRCQCRHCLPSDFEPTTRIESYFTAAGGILNTFIARNSARKSAIESGRSSGFLASMAFASCAKSSLTLRCSMLATAEPATQMLVQQVVGRWCPCTAACPPAVRRPCSQSCRCRPAGRAAVRGSARATCSCACPGLSSCRRTVRASPPSFVAASAKSISFTSPSGFTRKLSGLMSRWIQPCA